MHQTKTTGFGECKGRVARRRRAAPTRSAACIRSFAISPNRKMYQSYQPARFLKKIRDHRKNSPSICKKKFIGIYFILFKYCKVMALLHKSNNAYLLQYNAIADQTDKVYHSSDVMRRCIAQTYQFPILISRYVVQAENNNNKKQHEIFLQAFVTYYKIKMFFTWFSTCVSRGTQTNRSKNPQSIRKSDFFMHKIIQ